MATAEQNQPATIQDVNSHKRQSEAIEAEISSADSFCLTNWFLSDGSSFDTSLMRKLPHNTQPLVHKLASLHARFVCGASPVTG